ncbi:MAG TPA: T9SS type A sorting domain-containing protein, partial [bacterium]|nr:T9SS type A sorting domain-containing protein [bacterium]
GFFELNPEYDSSRDSLVDDRVGFTPFTSPSTSNNNQAFTGISIDSIGPAGFNMDFRIKWHEKSGSKIVFNIPDGFDVHDIIPVDLGKNLDGLAVAGNEIFLYDSLGNQISSENSLDLTDYSTVKLFFDQNNKNLFVLAENDQNLRIAAWQIINSSDLNFQDSVQIENAATTSNSILIDNSLVSGVVESGNNMLVSWELTDQGLEKSEQSVDTPIQSLTGNANNCYYLSENRVGRIDSETLNINELVNDSRISGNTLFSGHLNNNEKIDLVYNGAESSGIVLDVDETTIIRTITPGFEKIALSDIDGDGLSEIINITSTGELASYNANLNLENNFPVQIGHELVGEPLSYDVNDNRINDVVLVTDSGELYAFDYKGRHIGAFPLTTNISDTDRLCLMNTTGSQVAFIGTRTGTSHISATKMGTGKLAASSWYCQAGNTNRSFLLEVVETQQLSEDVPVLNKDKTFCWPNPVKQSTTNIRYFVNRPATVKIDIYDLAGNFVKSFKDEDPDPLVYNEISWNVDNIESGVYFAMLQASDDSGSQKEIIKIMVIK